MMKKKESKIKCEERNIAWKKCLELEICVDI